ncbi:MAG: hypothetical protein EAZ92_10035 [Candidatus Kapaibacterium sp.]|nr:MAG: hypothetical protein EAZ92_10035 [Candidatus Kapabacteria bacterium]
MAPLITAFAPIRTSTGTQVVITGNNFTGETTVRFNGRAAASYTVVSDTEIRAFPAANTPLTGSTSALPRRNVPMIWQHSRLSQHPLSTASGSQASPMVMLSRLTVSISTMPAQ